MQRVLKVRPVYNFFECGKSVSLNNSVLVLMLNQEAKDVACMKSRTGIRLMLGFFPPSDIMYVPLILAFPVCLRVFFECTL